MLRDCREHGWHLTPLSDPSCTPTRRSAFLTPVRLLVAALPEPMISLLSVCPHLGTPPLAQTLQILPPEPPSFTVPAQSSPSPQHLPARAGLRSPPTLLCASLHLHTRCPYASTRPRIPEEEGLCFYTEQSSLMALTPYFCTQKHSINI